MNECVLDITEGACHISNRTGSGRIT